MNGAHGPRILLIDEGRELAHRLAERFSGDDVCVGDAREVGAVPLKQFQFERLSNRRRISYASCRPDIVVVHVPSASDTRSAEAARWLRARMRDKPMLVACDFDCSAEGDIRHMALSPLVDFVSSTGSMCELALRIERLLRHYLARPVRSASRAGAGGSRRQPAARWPAIIAQGVDEGIFYNVVPEFHDPGSGRLDAKRITAFFRFPLNTLARLLGRELSTVSKTPDAPAIQPGLTVFEHIAAALLYLTGSEEGGRMWLNASNAELEGHTPIGLIQSGRAAVVANVLDSVLAGIPS